VSRLLISFFLMLSVSACGVPGALQPSEPSSSAYLINNVRLLTMSGDDILEGQSVLIVDGIIDSTGPSGTLITPDDVIEIDGVGHTLMPGLIDMHVHVFDETDLAANLAHGVTTIRNMGGMPFHLGLAQRISQGQIRGPRLITTGPIINELGGRNSSPLHVSVLGEDEARAEVRRQYEEGYRHLKLYSNLSAESFASIRDEAEILGMTMSGHPVEGTEVHPILISETLDAGFVTLEHTESIVWHALSDEIDRDRARLMAREIARSQTIVSPTLVVHENLARIVETQGSHLERPVMASFNPVIAGFEADNYEFWSAYQRDDRSVMQDYYVDVTGLLFEEGTRLVVGTDAGVMATPHGVSVARELELLVDAGLSPFQALEAATINPAQALGLGNDIGRILPGMRADFMLIAGDPTQDISAVRNISGVMHQGEWLDAEDLNELDEASHHPSSLRTWWRLLIHKLRN